MVLEIMTLDPVASEWFDFSVSLNALFEQCSDVKLQRNVGSYEFITSGLLPFSFSREA